MAERRGRSARVAKRQAAPAPEERAVKPGMVGGRYRPLSDTASQDVFEAALQLLERFGMAGAVPRFVDVVTKAGGSLDDDGRLLFPRRVVLGAIDTAAKAFTWHGFDDAKSIRLEDHKVHFGTAGAAVLMLDSRKRKFRASQLFDLYDLARLVDTLEHIHFCVRSVVPRDIEDSRELDINTAYATIRGTTKPIGTSFFQPGHVRETVEMFDMIAGGKGEFAKRPWCVANNTFVVPPLRYAEDSALAMIAQVETGMPINLLSAGQAGATSPAALAGSLAQGLAECLSALTVVNLMKPGHPCVVGLWPFVSDLRTGAMTGGSGEEAELNAAAAQVVNDIGLPSGVAAGMTDSKYPDHQAGYEKAMTVGLAAAAGANLVYESAGMLASLLGCSLEAMVADNDMMGAINRTVRGIEVTPDTLSVDVINEVIHGDGHFLGSSQTLDLMQKEYIYPDISDRLTPAVWEQAGSYDMVQRAEEVVEKTMSSHHPTHIPDDLDTAIREQFPIRLPKEALTGADRRWPPPIDQAPTD